MLGGIEQSRTCVLGGIEQSCTCVLVGILSLSMIFRLDIGTVQTVYISTKVVSYSLPACGEVYSIKLNVKKCVSDLWQVVGFL